MHVPGCQHGVVSPDYETASGGDYKEEGYAQNIQFLSGIKFLCRRDRYRRIDQIGDAREDPPEITGTPQVCFFEICEVGTNSICGEGCEGENEKRHCRDLVDADHLIQDVLFQVDDTCSGNQHQCTAEEKQQEGDGLHPVKDDLRCLESFDLICRH